MKVRTMRIGVDLGGTKIEGVVLDDDGGIVARARLATPQGRYDATVEAVRDLVLDLERQVGSTATVGIGMPGSISATTGLVRNANSVCLNGQPLAADLSTALAREVRVENDANCFALSEATDGAGAGYRVVFGVILGTGVGGGIVCDRRLWTGRQSIAGEWGHNEMPRRADEDYPSPPCYCGRSGCIETYLCGPALARSHDGGVGVTDVRTIVARARDGEVAAVATMARFHLRLAKALSSVVNVLDPHVIVLGGGLSNIDELYERVREHLSDFVFSDRCDTPVVRNVHGDSSGVRGAAWLWPVAPQQP